MSELRRLDSIVRASGILDEAITHLDRPLLCALADRIGLAPERETRRLRQRVRLHLIGARRLDDANGDRRPSSGPTKGDQLPTGGNHDPSSRFDQGADASQRRGLVVAQSSTSARADGFA